MSTIKELFDKDPMVVPLDYTDDECYIEINGKIEEEITYLMWLVWKGEYCLLKKLFNKYDKQKLKKIINLKSCYGLTALHITSYIENYFIILGKYQSKEYENDLQYRIIELLINNGADVNSEDLFENTILHHIMYFDENSGYYCGYPSLNTIKLLLDKGADPTKSNKYGRRTPIYYSAKCDCDKKMDILYMFLEVGGGYYLGELCDFNKDNPLIDIIKEFYEYIKTEKKKSNGLKDEVNKLKEENAKLKLELSLVPGGEVYEEAKNHFYGLVEEKK